MSGEDRPSVVCYEAGEWTAVYLDGALQRVGDTYLAHEWLVEHFGVLWMQDDAFLRGGDGRSDVAKTLEELDEYAAARERRRAEAANLRAEADRLLAQANELDARGGTP